MERRTTILLLDGARPDVFAQLTAKGDLPHVSRHVLDPGGVVPATTVFPSTTGVAYLPILTGCYPGTLNVPGIRWLDPRYYNGDWWRDRQHVRSYCSYQGGMLNTDVPPEIVSLFDLEPDAVALCSPFVRGLNPAGIRLPIARAFWGSVAHYVPGAYHKLDALVGKALAAAAGERPRLVFAVFPGPDGLAHHLDPWHPEVLDLYRQFDDAVGRYAANGGFDGDHLAIVLSDHGMSRVDRHIDLDAELEAYGLRALSHPVIWRRDPKVAVMVSGNASAQIYLNPGVPRRKRWDLSAIESGDVPGIPRDLPDFLAHLPGVAMVALMDGAELVALSRDGRARLAELDGELIRYAPETGDVLGLGASPALRDDRDCLTHSYDRPFPDAPVQLLQLFRSPRAGDIAVVAEPGADLRDGWEIPAHRSGHGSLIAAHMRCLMALNQRVSGTLRTTDAFALAAQHLGHALPAGIDAAAPSERRV